MKRYVLAAVAALALVLSTGTTAFALPLQATVACELADLKTDGQDDYDCPGE